MVIFYSSRAIYACFFEYLNICGVKETNAVVLRAVFAVFLDVFCKF